MKKNSIQKSHTLFFNINGKYVILQIQEHFPFKRIVINFTLGNRRRCHNSTYFPYPIFLRTSLPYCTSQSRGWIRTAAVGHFKTHPSQLIPQEVANPTHISPVLPGDSHFYNAGYYLSDI